MEPGIVVSGESLSLFHLVSPFTIGQGRAGCLVLVFVLGCFVFVCCVLSVPDLPTMTISAQLNDCHSC